MKTVLAFPPSTTLQLVQALQSALTVAEEGMLRDVLIVGYDEDEALFVRSSKLSRADALWLCEMLRRWVVDGEQA